MQSKKFFVGIGAAVVFIVGAGYIVYMGRPVMKNASTLRSSQGQTATVPANQGGSTSGNGAMGPYAMADVQLHNSRESCWSAIGGNVYDLTTWISRHPGGEGPILSLCGTDGTETYTNQHGDSRRPKAMLALLQIGTLK